jgi:uncharacterized OB-fold protein
MRGEAAAIGKMVGEILRDVGYVGFCRACGRAEMPGVLTCGRCGAVLDLQLGRSKRRRFVVSTSTGGKLA